MSQRMLLEANRHGLPLASFVAVAWVESDFNRFARGKHGEVGAFQAMQREHGIEDSWDWMRNHPKGFALAMKWGAIPWGRLGHKRVTVLRSVAEGTYIAARAIKAHTELCRRLGHRVGPGHCKSAFINRCPKRHRYEIDRIGHFNSGIRWPYPGYLRKLRRRAKAVARWMKGGK